MSKLKAACAASLAAAVLLSTACTSTQPNTVTLRVTPKAKTTPQMPDTGEESELDDLTSYGGPAVLLRNLPLAGTQWEWEGIIDQDQSDNLNPPSGYRLEFKPNGWFEFQADCRHGAGIYEITRQHIALAVIKATHSTCQRGSKAEDFQNALEGTKTFRQDDGKLYLDLKGGTKTMVFVMKP